MKEIKHIPETKTEEYFSPKSRSMFPKKTIDIILNLWPVNLRVNHMTTVHRLIFYLKNYKKFNQKKSQKLNNFNQNWPSPSSSPPYLLYSHTFLTVPSEGDFRMFSIFMASKTAIASPFSMLWPFSTFVRVPVRASGFHIIQLRSGAISIPISFSKSSYLSLTESVTRIIHLDDKGFSSGPESAFRDIRFIITKNMKFSFCVLSTSAWNGLPFTDWCVRGHIQL